MEVAMQPAGGFPSQQFFGGHHHQGDLQLRRPSLSSRRPSLKISTFFPAQSRTAPRMEAPPRNATSILPPEIWRLVLNTTPMKHDLPSLWRKCRQVCRTFQEAVDDIFKKDVLTDMMIEFDLDWDYLDQKNLTEKCFFGLEMAFDRFADEKKEIAVFKNSISTHAREPGYKERHDKMERAKWKEKMSVYTPPGVVGSAAMDTRFDLPPWSIEIKGDVNDTELPGWQVNYEAKEISFRWKDAMEAFYREAEYIDKKLITEITKGVHSGLFEKLHEGVTSGKMTSAKAFLETTRLKENASFTAKRTIRRHRIQKFYTENYELDPDKHTYDLQDIIHNVDAEAEEEALMRMRDMEWTRSNSLLSLLLGATEGPDPLSDPMAEDFLQRLLDPIRDDESMTDLCSEDDLYEETEVEEIE